MGHGAKIKPQASNLMPQALTNFTNMKFNSMLAVLPALSITGNLSLGIKGIGSLIVLAAVLFAVELALFLVPGVSLSSLIIALACLYYPFWIVFAVSLFPVFLAHFLITKNPSAIVPDFLTLLPMVAFWVFAGPLILKNFSGFLGWSVYGALFSLVKWGGALPVGIMTGRSMGKRFRELLLEPIGSSIIFQGKTFFFFLFPGIAAKLASLVAG